MPTPRSTATAAATPTPPPSTPTPRPTPRPQPPHLASASLRPDTVPAGATLNATVAVSGHPGRVDMYLGSGAPTAPPPMTFPLSESSPGTWTGSGTAPSVPGQYHFTVGIYVHGNRTIVDNDGWNIQVTGSNASPTGVPAVSPTPTPSPAAQPLPANIPLAPPFSYSNPSPAVFSAEGKTISGSEVVSTTQSTVAPSVIAQYYETHLPRAGWTIDQSTVPASGATSFSIAATSGSNVCIVEYNGSTVQIFYGSLPVG